MSVIELGYRSDYDPEKRKVIQKQQQHNEMVDALRAWYEVDYQVWDVGHTGMITNSLKLQAQRLGVPDADKLLKDIHRIANEYALHIIHDRRAQERTLHPGPADVGNNNNTRAPAKHPIGPPEKSGQPYTAGAG